MSCSEFFIPGAYPSTANLREHWARKARRVKKQREEARLLTRFNVGLTLSADIQAFGGTVIMTRYAPRKLDDDNLAGCLKAARDGVASALGVNDGDSRIAWVYKQARCRDGEQYVDVTVMAARPELSGEGGAMTGDNPKGPTPRRFAWCWTHQDLPHGCEVLGKTGCNVVQYVEDAPASEPESWLTKPATAREIIEADRRRQYCVRAEGPGEKCPVCAPDTCASEPTPRCDSCGGPSHPRYTVHLCCECAG